MGTLGSNSKMGESPQLPMTPQQPGKTNKQTHEQKYKHIKKAEIERPVSTLKPGEKSNANFASENYINFQEKR